MSNVNINISITPKELELLKQYAAVYDSEREIDGSADPIVIVEVPEEILASSDGLWDEERYFYEDEVYTDEDELIAQLRNEGWSDDDIDDAIWELNNEGKSQYGGISVQYIKTQWRPVAYFLTRAEAQRYCQYQGHNLKTPRIYTAYCGYSNDGDLKHLSQLLLRISKTLEV